VNDIDNSHDAEDERYAEGHQCIDQPHDDTRDKHLEDQIAHFESLHKFRKRIVKRRFAKSRFCKAAFDN